MDCHSKRSLGGLEDKVVEYRKRGLEFISQALKSEEDHRSSAGSSSDKSEVPRLAKSLYKLGIQELCQGLNQLQLENENGDSHQKDQAFKSQQEREMLKVLSDAKNRLEFLDSATQLRREKTGCKSSCSFRDEHVQPRGDLEGGAVSSRAAAAATASSSPSFAASTLSSSLKSKSSSNSTPKKMNHALKKPEMFMSELEKFLSHSIVSCKATPDRVTFADVIGQTKAKKALDEMVIMPALRPELFSGLRTPAKGLLLFGPPGNGKTLLVKGLAGEMKATTLFSITASSLTSKFVGEGEKLVKTLFDMARARSPAIIFIDEVDSILCSRKESDHEASRRLKTEFFASFDGLVANAAAAATANDHQAAKNQQEQRILVVGATNRPQELDDAALRRFTKRIYIPMPDLLTRKLLLVKLLSVHDDPLTGAEIDVIAKATAGYSCSDVTNLCREAALSPLRDHSPTSIKNIGVQDIRPISCQDFVNALAKVRTSASTQLLQTYQDWNDQFGDVS